jgi:hypothetical protein
MTRTLSILFLLFLSVFGSGSAQAQQIVVASVSGPDGTGEININLSDNSFTADLPGATQSSGVWVYDASNAYYYLYMRSSEGYQLLGYFIPGSPVVFHRSTTGTDYTVTGFRFL